MLTPEWEKQFSPEEIAKLKRYVSWFHELDAWTEYWDIYHPESRGHFYFGDGDKEPGLLRRFLPRDLRPAPFVAWTRMALSHEAGAAEEFVCEVRTPEVASAVMEVDGLLAELFAKHFGDAREKSVASDYLGAMYLFATNSLPPAIERDARIPADDPRKSTAGHHTLQGDIMWFAWSLHTEAAHAIAGRNEQHSRRALFMAGVATGCPADFAVHGHRYTRQEYVSQENLGDYLHELGMMWAGDFEAAAAEVHALYRIREWRGEE
ncbi:MAG: hypothetical protein JSS69_17470 [Acidobacteria bacterium]|nr:hypothetical protein [Acidobacteriota bacterium]